MNKPEPKPEHPDKYTEKPNVSETRPGQKNVESTRDQVKEVVHQRTFKPGKYRLFAIFINTKGEKVKLEITDINKIHIHEETDESKMKKEMISRSCGVGLHNCGMNVYYGDYPHGHPVTLEVKDEHGESFEFVEYFDGSGYPVKE